MSPELTVFLARNHQASQAWLFLPKHLHGVFAFPKMPAAYIGSEDQGGDRTEVGERESAT